MQRNLASIQTIKEIKPIDGADKIETASFTNLGWQVVVERGKYKAGDSVVFAEIDSLLPIRPEFEFLRKNCYKKLSDGSEGFRIKTVRLRSQISQGICFPLDILKGLKYPNDHRENPVYNFKEGQDITALIGVRKYEIYIPAQMAGIAKGAFPSFLHKSDTTRVQACPEVIQEFQDKDVYISIKIDGTSCTMFTREGEYGVCSRNLELVDGANVYWDMFKKFDIQNKLMELKQLTGQDFAIQCEVAGAGIQSNRLGLNDVTMFVYDLYNITLGRYLNFDKLKEYTTLLKLPTVPYIYTGKMLWQDTHTMLEYSNNQVYASNKMPAEGIVVRPTVDCHSKALKSRLAVKAISNTFLLKYGE
jgi:RNA ligase (TIGR02306 family)